jgi:pimeloyl-ACP methyl ester carboxylesterase
LAEIEIPALVVHRESDSAISLDLAPARRGPTQVGAEDRCLPGHASNLTDPDPVNEAIEASLETLPLGA